MVELLMDFGADTKVDNQHCLWHFWQEHTVALPFSGAEEETHPCGQMVDVECCWVSAGMVLP